MTQDASPATRRAAAHTAGVWAKWYLEILQLRETARSGNGYLFSDGHAEARLTVLERSGLYISKEGTFPKEVAFAFAGRMGDLVTALVKVVRQEKDTDTRKEALRALGQMPLIAARFAPLLLSVTNDEDGEIRTEARAIVEKLPAPPAKAITAILPFLSASRYETRYAAFDLLAKMKEAASPAVPQLRQALADPAEGIRDAAARALAAIGPNAHDAIPDLLAILKKSGPRQSILANRAAEALGAIGPAAHAATQELCWRSTQEATAAASLEALANIGSLSPETLGAFVEAMKSDNAEIRIAAFTALGALLQKPFNVSSKAAILEAVAELKKAAFQDKLPHARDRALTALARSFARHPDLLRDTREPMVLGMTALQMMENAIEKNTKGKVPVVSEGTIALFTSALSVSPPTDRLSLLEKLNKVFAGQLSLPYSVPLAEVLKQMLDTSSSRQQALVSTLMLPWTLEFRDRAVVPVLAAITDGKTDIGREAGKRLAVMVTPKDGVAGEAFLRLLAGTDVDSLLTAKYGLARLGTAGVRAVGRGIAAPDSWTRVRALQLAEEAPHFGQALTTEILEAARDREAKVRTQALRTLVSVAGRDAAARDWLLALRKEKDPEVRSWLALAIGKLSADDKALPWLLDESRDKDPIVRFRVALALGYSKNPKGQARLVEMLKDDEHNTRRAAIDALGDLPPTEASVRGLAESLADPDHGGRAAVSLARLGSASNAVIPRALELLRSASSEKTSANAAYFLSLRQEKPEIVLPALQKVFERPGGGLGLNLTLVNALQRYGPRAASSTPTALKRMAAAQTDWEKRRYLQFLTVVGKDALPFAPETTQTLEKMAASDERALSASALAALTATSGVARAEKFLRSFPLETQETKLIRMKDIFDQVSERRALRPLLERLSGSDDGSLSQTASSVLHTLKLVEENDKETQSRERPRR